MSTEHDEPDAKLRAAAWGFLPLSRVRLPLPLDQGAWPRSTCVANPGERTIAADEEEEPLETAALEDPVRRYLSEIGKAKLLTGSDEVALGRRIEFATSSCSMT